MPAELMKSEKELSPFERLNQEFSMNNNQLEEMINRITQRLHKVSNTSVPTELENKVSGTPVALPFSDGYFMSYYDQLRRTETLLSKLNHEVYKLESLV